MAEKTFVELAQENLGQFPAGLIYAVLECLLIIFLFIDGLLSFFSNEFARFFGLKIPCFLCNRMDHRIIRRDPDFYYKHLLCDSHALEVSFLAYCHVHRRLANVSRMCKGCLLSFTVTDNRSGSDAYRSLVDILAADFEDEPKPLRRQRPSAGDDEGTERCSCCEEPLRIKASYLPRLVRMLSDAGDVPETPSTMRSTAAVDGDFHPLSHHVRYRGIRLTSDTDSEALEEDDETSTTIISENGEMGKLGTRSFSADRLALDGYIVSPDEQSALVPGSDSSVQSTARILSTSGDGAGIGEGGGISDPVFSRLAPDHNAKDRPAANVVRELGDLKMTINVTPTKVVGKMASDVSKISAALSPRLSMLRKRLSMKRNDVGTGSFKGTMGSKASFSQGEGETLLHRLKRQVRLDRKSLIALCAELDQERSASAVAANQAMAMINRLQEEKAAVQMEALQYQRMMEEQAEYDQEALQTMKNLLSKRDSQINSMVSELKVYRERFAGENIRLEGSDTGDELDTPLIDKRTVDSFDFDNHPISLSPPSTSQTEQSEFGDRADFL